MKVGGKSQSGKILKPRVRFAEKVEGIVRNKWGFTGFFLAIVAFSVGMCAGKYGEAIFKSIVWPLHLISSEQYYDGYCSGGNNVRGQTMLKPFTVRRILEREYGESIERVIGCGWENGVYLYDDGRSLYAEWRKNESWLSRQLHTYMPWVYSDHMRKRGLIVDKRTGRLFNRDRNRWETKGLICLTAEEFRLKISPGLPIMDFMKMFGEPSTMWEKSDGSLFLEYDDVDFNRLVVVFKDERFQYVEIMYIYQVEVVNETEAKAS